MQICVIKQFGEIFKRILKEKLESHKVKPETIVLNQIQNSNTFSRRYIRQKARRHTHDIASMTSEPKEY